KERKIVIPITAVDIYFKECPVGRDLERPHQNRSLMNKWVGEISRPDENPAYAFNIPIFGHKYKENPYIPQLISASRQKIKEVYQTELHRKEQIKTAIAVKCSYSCSRREIDDIDEHITRSVGELDAQVEEALLRGSGYTLIGILTIYIEVYTLRRGTGESFIPTPKKLANTKCTINPDNQGLIDPETNKLSEKCLQAKNLKPYLDIVKLDGIPMPTPICSRIFDKIEEMNPDITISVWEWKEETATPKPVIASKNFKRQHKIRLLALTDITKSEDDKDSAHKEKKHLYDGCFQSFPSEKSLDHHIEWCPGIHENAPQRVTMPVKGVNDFKEFKNYGRMINAPCVIIADFEADNKKCDEKYGGSMRKLAEQKANSFCYLVHWIDTGDVWGPFLYRRENATQEFVRRIDQELVHINEVLAIKHERIETEKDKKRFAEADTCWICKGKIAIDREEVKCLENKASWLNNKLENTPKNSEDYKALTTQILKVTKAIDQAEAMDIKVWDHCHITGEFRGSAHRDCNLKLQIQDWKTPISVIFHNFRGYDSHLVCESVGRSANAIQIRVIAKTFERYKSMKVGQLKYIDSMQFMNSSLASLTKNLGDNHPITSQYFKKLGYTEEQIALVYRKGIYCYDYIDSQDRFLETELPPIHEFHSTLKGEYHDIYLKTDVLSLADVWTEFRKMSMEYYELDPSHYVSAPSLSWDAQFKMTGVRIELFTDMAMHDFTEKAKRGGISMACQRYFKANNPKMGEAYDPSKPTSWISYVDATNLYGHSMSQYLPIGNYQWEASREYLLKNPAMQKAYLEMVLKAKPNARRGYFLNIKSHFPLKTHDYLRDLLPAVENVAVEKDWLCPYNAKLVEHVSGSLRNFMVP
ncbi:9297_t:CDS:2, partial [Cetraspora pellucida]